jgi:predicted enzyme related to lactoylglutathione lyase
MNRVIHFEIHADHPERAVAFYKSVFSWHVEKWPGPIDYWLAHTGEGEGIDGAIKKRMVPALTDSITSFVCTIGVDSIDDIVRKIATNGGSVIMPKTEIPGVGWHAYCKDTEGNLFGLMQEK